MSSYFYSGKILTIIPSYSNGLKTVIFRLTANDNAYLQKNIDRGIKLILTSLEMRIVQCEQALTQFIEQNMEITSMYMLEVD